jgi:Protein of unknown function (DUF3035)
MRIRSPRAVSIAAVVGGAVVLTGCSTLRDAAGMGKTAPDEFAVLTKAPLVIPPDYNLMPPKPGAVPTNQTAPTESAEMALFGSDPATIASSIQGNYSQGEKLLLANAGIANSDPNIRADLASDNKGMVGADDSFTNEILFWNDKPKTDAGTPVNADEEARRLHDQNAGQGGDQKPQPEAPKQKDKGWFDGWFDWL